MTRHEFDDALLEVEANVHRMADCVVEMLELGVRCVLDGTDSTLVDRVRTLDNVVDESERKAMNLVFDMFLTQQPVADDLRKLVTTLSIVGHLEQAGDDAEKLASRGRKASEIFPDEFKSVIYDLQGEAGRVIKMAVSLYDDYTDEVAEQVLAIDDEVDTTYKSARRVFLEMIEEQPASARQLYRCVSVFHAIEHVADRGVEIVKRLRMHNHDYAGPE